MEKQQNSYFRNVTLKDLLTLFINRLWMIVLAAVAVVGIMAVIVNVTFVPQYNSTATLYILRQRETENSSASASDFALALNVVQDCTYALKSDAVLQQVIDELNLTTTTEELKVGISTENPESTRFLKVTATGSTPKEAQKIVNKLCSIGVVKITETLGLNQANIFESGTENAEPSNKTTVKDYITAGFIAAAAVYLLALLIFVLDDSIASDEDIQEMLGLAILGDIPNANATSEQYYGKRSKYAYYAPRSKKRRKFLNLFSGKRKKK